MFTPISKASTDLKAHLRYPEDLFSIQAAIYGRYHITSANQFFAVGKHRRLTRGASRPPRGSVRRPMHSPCRPSRTRRGRSSGHRPSGWRRCTRCSPNRARRPSPSPSRTPTSPRHRREPGPEPLGVHDERRRRPTRPAEGVLHTAGTERGRPGAGRLRIQQNPNVSKQISLLDQRVERGARQHPDDPHRRVGPVRQTLYTVSQGNPQPQLQDVIAVFGQQVDMETSLDSALSQVLGTAVGSGSSPAAGVGDGHDGPVELGGPATDRHRPRLRTGLLHRRAGGTGVGHDDALATYESDIEAMSNQIAAAKSLLGTAGTGGYDHHDDHRPKKTPAKQKRRPPPRTRARPPPPGVRCRLAFGHQHDRLPERSLSFPMGGPGRSGRRSSPPGLSEFPRSGRGGFEDVPSRRRVTSGRRATVPAAVG